MEKKEKSRESVIAEGCVSLSHEFSPPEHSEPRFHGTEVGFFWLWSYGQSHENTHTHRAVIQHIAKYGLVFGKHVAIHNSTQRYLQVAGCKGLCCLKIDKDNILSVKVPLFVPGSRKLRTPKFCRIRTAATASLLSQRKTYYNLRRNTTFLETVLRQAKVHCIFALDKATK